MKEKLKKQNLNKKVISKEMKEDKDEERTSNEENEKEASSQNKDKEILGKRKQHTPTPTSGYNIEQQDLSGQICQYIQVEETVGNRKRKIDKYNHNE